MNHDDLPSDSESDDSDYRPVNDSGSESIDEKEELLQEDQNNEKSASKSNKKKRKKGRKTRNNKVEINNEEQEEETNKTVADPEEEKKRVDALWADFLSGTEIPLSTKEESSSKSTSATSNTTLPKKDIPKIQKSDIPKETPKIFEFAGETIEIPQKDSSENSSSLNNSVKSPPTNSLGTKRPSSTGGLSSVLNQLSKKNKLSVLEKTKLDWDGFKTSEGISEELKTHNRGRAGYVWLKLM